MRIALYSHDTMGLGHMRRNMLIANALASSDLKASILLIAGSHEAGFFSMPDGVDCLTLPAIRKEMEGQYQSRHLNISLQKLVTMRSKSICAALEEFEPDVLIVDKEPCGINGELELALRSLHERGHTKFVLGLRDILDKPLAMSEDLVCETCASNEDDIRRYYDAIWIYGDPNIYDLVSECGFSPDVAEKVSFTGYFDQRQWLNISGLNNSVSTFGSYLNSQYVLCTVGGGQDGDKIALTFAEAEFPSNTYGVIVTGPFMPKDVKLKLYYLASMRRRLIVIEFLAEHVLLSSRAAKIISMGGYNTICEVLSFEKHALVVPRVKPRLEQYIRAVRLKNLDMIDILHPDKLNPNTLSDWMARDVKKDLSLRNKIDMNGLKRLPGMLTELLKTSSLPYETMQILHG